MKIIPVIDLKDGIVVSAQQGMRERYQAIDSKLCISSSIFDVIDGFLSVYDFKMLYIADLNAITHTGDNQELIDYVIAENPTIEFWIDNGTILQDLSVAAIGNKKLIIGSESQNIENLKSVEEHLKENILSLDFFPDNGYTGPKELIENPALWPQDLIIMTLDRVGGKRGPDFEKLNYFCCTYPKNNFIAAGGVRDERDLIRLKEIGIYSVLVSSSLHSGKINESVIKKLQTKKYPA